MGLTLITPASGDVIALDEVKTLAGIEDDSFDAKLALLVPAAVAQVEKRIGRALGEQVWALTLPGFADAIALDNGPVLAIAEVRYLDSAGAEQVLNPAVYYTDLTVTPARLLLAEGESWPATASHAAAVTIEYSAGYGAAVDQVPLPGDLKLALLALVTHWFENGAAAGMPAGVERMLDPFKSWLI